MAGFIGIITDVGIEKMRDAQNMEGWKIYPESFGVSDVASAGSQVDWKTMTAPNAGEWYVGAISSRIPVDTDKMKFVCVIPPNQAASLETIEEIYIYAKDSNDDTFLMAVAQPTNTTYYDPDGGSTTLRPQITIINADLESILQFDYTQAFEVSVHNTDPNAHEDIRGNLEKAGIFEQPAEHEYIGQHFDEFAQFDAGIANGDLVYRDTDGVYKKAIYDGTIKGEFAGFADVSRGQVYEGGFYEIATGYDVGTRIYLSSLVAGEFTDTPTGKPVGLVTAADQIIIEKGNAGQYSSFIDVVVSDEIGFNHYPDMQDAIDACPDGGWVRVDKIYEVESLTPLDTNGKSINFMFTGKNSGIKYFEGLNEIQEIEFSQLPDEGEFVLVHDGNETTRLAHDVDAAGVESALEALASITDVTVTGNVTDGFVIEFTGVDQKQPHTQIIAGTNAGIDAVQHLDFDAVPDEGTFRLDFDGQITSAISWNEGATEVKAALEALSNLESVSVSGNYTSGFDITFTNANGKQPQNNVAVNSNSLKSSSVAVIVVPSSVTTGELPDVTLKSGGSDVAVSSTTTQEGQVTGSTTAITLENTNCQFIGMGVISGFVLGIDFNGHTNQRAEMVFENNINPIDHTGLTLSEFAMEGSIGYSRLNTIDSETIFRDLVKVVASVPNDYEVTVTPASTVDADGHNYGLVIDQNVSQFAGGTINFETGSVVNGNNFTPYTPSTAGNYYKYAVILKVDNTIEVVLPVGDAATIGAAPIPSITGGLLRGIVTVKDDGAGAPEIITPASIQRFLQDGAFAHDIVIEETTSTGGASVFTLFPTSGRTFDPDNDIQDIEVWVNGNLQTRAADGSADYKKISGTQIEFTDGSGGSFNVPAGAIVKAKYTGAFLDTIGEHAIEAHYEVEHIDSDGGAVYTTSAITFDINNDVHDIEVYINGVYKLQGASADYTKTANNEITFTDSIPNGAKITVKSRYFSMGAGSSQVKLEVRDEGSPIEPNAAVLDVVGDGASISQVSSGHVRLNVNAGESNTASNIGTGTGEFVSGKSGSDIEIRKARGLSGIKIETIGDEVVFSLATAPYWVEYLKQQTGLSILLSQNYDAGTNKLTPYRNGVRMINSVIMGDLENRYTELGLNVIGLKSDALVDDGWAFINEDVSPAFVYPVTNKNTQDITIPAYTVGDGRLRVWRNGVLMNNAGVGTSAYRYIELDSTTIRLDDVAELTETFLFEYAGVAWSSRQTVTGQVGNTLTVPSYVMGSEKLYVYRNGLLMLNTSDSDLGDNDQRYVEATSTTITLEVGAELSDIFTFIVKS